MGLGRALLWLIGREPDLNTEAEPSCVLAERKPTKYTFRPKTLDEYIGQKKAKERVQINLEKIKKYKPSHFIISGSAGTGKTTLAYVIANHLNAKVYYTIAEAFDREALKQFLLGNEKDRDNLHVLLIDEIHSIDRKIAELLYPLVEDFQLPVSTKGNTSPTYVKPFVFMGATTDKDELFRKVSPLVDRCSSGLIDLEDYTIEDLMLILSQYSQFVYNELLLPEIYKKISENCKFTPRIALALLDDYVVTKDLKRVLSAYRIVKDGLTETDIKILQRLVEAGKPIGEQSLSMGVGLVKRQYITLYEPFLIKQNYIRRTPRREITDKGKKILAEIK
jgi:Holliday junction DNA helicase RuvB